MNDLVIRTSDIYTLCNSTEVLNAQALAKKLSAQPVNSQQSYNEAAEAIKAVNAAIKNLEEGRKQITQPLDAAKKHIMAAEAEAVDSLLKFIANTKALMLAFHKEEQRKEAEAKAAVLSPTAEIKGTTPAEQMEMITARLTGGMAAKTKNVRKVLKARTDGTPVDWMRVMTLLTQAGVIEPDEPVSKLPKALKNLGLEGVKIGGVELYFEEVQTV